MITGIVRYTFRIIGKLLYKVKVTGSENYPLKGGALLIPNHNSLLDAAIVAAGQPRMVRFVIYKEVFKSPVIGKFLHSLRMIPIASTRSKTELFEFYEKCKREINTGEIVCVFPEGEMPRNGFMLGFKKGFELIARQTEAPIIPFYVDNALGSPFTFKTGNPKAIGLKFSPFRTPVTIAVGKKLPPETNSFQIRQKLKELESEAFTNRVKDDENLISYLLLYNKKAVTYHDLALKNKLSGKTIKNQNIVLDVSPVDYFYFMKIALLSGKTVVSKDMANEQIVHLWLSQHVAIENKSIPVINAEVLKKSVDLLTLSTGVIGRLFPFTQLFGRSDMPALITKNGLYSHKNLILCALSLNQVLSFSKNEVMAIAIDPQKPISAVFSLLALFKGLKSYYYNIENQEQKSEISILVSERNWIENNFLLINSAIDKIIITDGIISPEIKKHLSSEKCISVLEGYGDDYFPVISLNTPDFEGKDIAGKEFVQQCSREGSVGRLLPGVSAKICNEFDHDLVMGESEEGQLLVKGFEISEKTLKNAGFTNSWYVSCVNGIIDKDGFLFIKNGT